MAMNKPDRDFLVFTRRLLAELRAISASLFATHKDTEATPEQQHTHKQTQQTPPILRAELQIPEAIERDRKIQNRKKVRREWVVIGVNVLTLFAVIAYAWINYHMLYEMEKATKAAQQSANTAISQLEITDRPWVKVVPKKWSSITFGDKGDMRFSAILTLSNIGKSVATDVTVNHGAFVPAPNAVFDEPQKRQATLCKEPPQGALRVTLFPTDTTDLGIADSISKRDMEANTVPPPPGLTRPKPPGKRVSPFLYGCIDYKSGNGIKHHQTGFVYNIVRTYPQHPEVPYLIIIGQELPAANVQLQKWPLGGDYAN
jgi:hypothetical protein